MTRGRCPAMLNPSAWVTRFAPLIPRRGHVLDVAAGGGRHTAWLLLNGWRVTACDVDVSALEPLVGLEGLTLEARDLEGEPWPWGADMFDGIVVTNYLHREHFPYYWQSLRPGGILIMETFLRANREIWGRPARDAHSWMENELLDFIPEGARVVAFEQGLTKKDLAMARIVLAKRAAAEPLVFALEAD